jgi:hypothetical protein
MSERAGPHQQPHICPAPAAVWHDRSPIEPSPNQTIDTRLFTCVSHSKSPEEINTESLQGTIDCRRIFNADVHYVPRPGRRRPIAPRSRTAG